MRFVVSQGARSVLKMVVFSRFYGGFMRFYSGSKFLYGGFMGISKFIQRGPMVIFWKVLGFFFVCIPRGFHS